MIDLSRMTPAEVIAEADRRRERRKKGLPLEETPAEAAVRIADDDARLEKAIQADVMKLYHAHGCTVRNLSQARRSKQAPGLPDLYVTWPRMTGQGPIAWWHETKTPTGVQSPAQRTFQIDNEACGVSYVIGGVPAAAAFLDKIGARRGELSHRSAPGAME